MKPAWALLLTLALIVSLAGCGGLRDEPPDMGYIKSYRDIPGVTDDEIAAIESLKEKRESLSYGSSISTIAFILPDGSQAGFTPEFCGLLSSLFDINIEVEFREWDDLLDGINDKTIDFTGELTPTPERQKIYFMSHPIAEHFLSAYTGDESGHIETEADLEGKRVGFLKSTITTDSIAKRYPILFEIVEIDTYPDAVRMLELGEIDAFVDESIVDQIFSRYDFIQSRQLFSLVYNQVSLTTANPELEPFISVVNKYLEAGGIDELVEIYQEGEREYAKYKLHQSFTEEEKAYLADLAAREVKVPVAYENENYPVSFYNDTEREFQGFAVDILSEISRITGIEFRAVTGNKAKWPELMEKLDTGEAAMITQLLYTDVRAGRYIWSRIPYDTVDYALLSKIDMPELSGSQLIRVRVGTIDKTAHEDLYREWFPESGNTVVYSTYEQSLTALENDEIDLLMASEYTLLHQTNFREKPGFKANVRFGIPMESFFGFNKNEEILRDIIDKTLPFIKSDAIVKGWTSRVFDYSRKYAVQLSVVLAVFVVSLLCILGIVIYLYTGNKRLDKRLKREAATVASIYASIPDMVFCKDINGTYISCNASFARLVGIKERDIVGKTTLQLFADDPEAAQRYIEADQAVIALNAPISTEEEFVLSDGSRRIHESMKAPLIQDGALIGVLGILRDIQDYKDAVEAAREASKAKSSFLAHMSHEIRTPMNAIAGMTELLFREEMPPAIYEYASGIKQAGANLLSLINDILDFSKIEAGGMEIIPAEYSFSSLINDVLMISRMKVHEKLILFTANIDADIPNRLIGDETRVRQILLNVLGNAAKYTNEGFIALSITGKTEGDAITLTAEVADSGVGIKKENMDTLFGEFIRFDNIKHKNIQGTGLGLAITRNLCHAMGGNISARSEYGCGSTFTMTIPQGIVPNGGKFAEVAEPESKRVLVYETRPVYADSMMRSLDDLRVPRTLAVSMEELCEQLSRFSYNFVLTSFKLREKARGMIDELSIDTRLILIVEPGETVHASDMGICRTIAMPIHAASIANLLNDNECDNAYTAGAQEKKRFIAPDVRVLIVDDINTNLKVTEGLLLPYQMNVDLCESGGRALELVRKNRYDIIFMDHMMPEMDGIEATEHIRAMKEGDGHYQNVPIIALTANAVSGVRELFIQKGMDDFLPKPVDVTKLHDMLERWIPGEKKERYVEIKQKSRGEGDMPAPIQLEGVDVNTGIELTGGQLSNYIKMLGIFHMEGTDKLDSIRECMENGDIKLYTTYVHAIKSAAASLGADEISRQAKALEIAGMKGDIELIQEDTGHFLSNFKNLLDNIYEVALKDKAESEETKSYDSEAMKAILNKLAEALEQLEAEKIDDIMSELQNVKWSEAAAELLEKLSRNIYLFDYVAAAGIVHELLSHC